MDIKTENEDVPEISGLRILAKRQKIRRIKTGQEKALLEMDRERDRLYGLLYQKEYIELDPPYQQGWRRTFEMRADVAAGSQADQFAEILKLINTVQFSLRKDFKIKKRYKGKKVYRAREQSLNCLGEQQWEKLVSRHRALFYEIWNVDKRTGYRKSYVFAEPWRYVLKVRPNMITRLVRINPDLESRCRQLDGMISSNHLQPAINRLKGVSSCWHWKSKSRYGERCKMKKTVQQYLQVIRDEEEII